MKMTPGPRLSPALRRAALANYAHRFTGDHTPAWVRDCPRPDGVPYKPHFATDSEWLENTMFPVHRGELIAHEPCQSAPTWPQGKG